MGQGNDDQFSEEESKTIKSRQGRDYETDKFPESNQTSAASAGVFVERQAGRADREPIDDIAPPPSFQLHCDTLNSCNDGLVNVNDRLERILDRIRGDRDSEKAEKLRGISSAGYNDTLGQLGSIYDNQLKRYFCLVDELERFL